MQKLWFLLLIPAFLAGLVLLAPVFFDPSFGFRHKNATYYSEYAHACDLLLSQHPLGTNKWIELPLSDPSLPKIIRDLPSFRVQVSQQRVWVLAAGTNHGTGFGITWEPQDETQTNIWVLRTIQESHERQIYSERR